MNEQDIKRTIDEVLDVESGEIIKSVIFFQKPESEIIAYRRRLQNAIAGFESPKFKCAYCNQLLKLSGKSTRRGQVSFFAHLYDSDDCEIKSNGDLSKEEIEARKYGNIGESERHIELKNKLAHYLKTTPEISNVEIEKRLTSEVPYLYWRRPDVYAEYNGKSIVFELQLSTTFLSVIIERDIFYRLNNIFIIWIFNFSDNEEYVNFQNLMIKDIYYANKRNAFVFDEKAQQLSEATGILHLLCIWFEPLIENGLFQQSKVIRKEEYISMEHFKFDTDYYKPYYVDADALFAEYQPRYFEKKIDSETLYKVHLEKIAKKNRALEHKQLLKNQKNAEVREQLENGNVKLQLIQKKEKFGFECNGIIIVEPTYNEIIEIIENKYYKVQKNKKYGVINYLGELVLDCDYKELILVFSINFIVNEKNEWYYIDVRLKEKTFIHKSRDKESVINLEKTDETAYIVRIEDTVGVLNKKYKFHKYDFIGEFGKDGFASAKRGGWWKGGSSTQSYNGFWHYTPKNFIEGSTVYIDKMGIELISNSLEINKGVFKGTKYEKWGIETESKETIIPFEYDLLEDFFDGRAKAKKNGKYGYINDQGQTIIPFEYDFIDNFSDGKAKAEKSSKFGYLNDEGHALIPFEYDSIDDFSDGKAKASKGEKYGFIDEQGQILIPFEYDSIGNYIDGRAKTRKNGKYGYIDEQGQTLIPFEFDSIENYIDGRAKTRKNGKYGYIDELGKILIPFDYDYIENFINGKCKAVKRGDSAIIDYNGNGIIIFREIINFKGKYGETITEFLYGIKDTNEQIILSPIYNKIDEFKNGFAKIYADKKYIGGGKYSPEFKYKVGFVDENGKIAAACIYDEISEFVDNKAIAKKNGKNLIVNIYSYELNSKITDYKILKLNSIHRGKIVNMVKFGIFVDLGDGITALLHVSELNKHRKSFTDFTNGQEIEVKIINIVETRNRISLTLL